MRKIDYVLIIMDLILTYIAPTFLVYYLKESSLIIEVKIGIMVYIYLSLIRYWREDFLDYGTKNKS
jgi:hypothetical protein